MKNRILAGLFLVLFCVGCTPFEGGAEAERLGKQSEQIAQTLAESIAAADKVAQTLENVSGTTLSPETVSKVEAVATKADNVLEKIDRVTSIAEKIPGPQQPFAVAADKVVGGLGILASAVLAFMANRRKKKAQAGLDTMIRATKDVPNMATKTAAAAHDPEALAAIKEAYNANH